MAEQAERPSQPTRRALTGDEKEKISRASQEIRDEELRQAFVRLMETHYSAGRPDEDK
jgi:hypothetical protein